MPAKLDHAAEQLPWETEGEWIQDYGRLTVVERDSADGALKCRTADGRAVTLTAAEAAGRYQPSQGGKTLKRRYQPLLAIRLPERTRLDLDGAEIAVEPGDAVARDEAGRFSLLRAAELRRDYLPVGGRPGRTAPPYPFPSETQWPYA